MIQFIAAKVVSFAVIQVLQLVFCFPFFSLYKCINLTLASSNIRTSQSRLKIRSFKYIAIFRCIPNTLHLFELFSIMLSKKITRNIEWYEEYPNVFCMLLTSRVVDKESMSNVDKTRKFSRVYIVPVRNSSCLKSLSIQTTHGCASTTVYDSIRTMYEYLTVTNSLYKFYIKDAYSRPFISSFSVKCLFRYFPAELVRIILNFFPFELRLRYFVLPI